MLFAAELEVLQPLFLSALVAQRERPVSPLERREIQELERVRAAGRVRADGPVCAQPPALERVALARFPELLSAQLLVRCNETCVVSLELRRSTLPFTGVGRGERVLELTRSVGDPERLAGYADAVRALAAAPTSRSARALGKISPPETLLRTQITSAQLGPGWSDGMISLSPDVYCRHGHDVAMFELSAEGEVERCEIRGNDPPATRCDLCKALRLAPQTRGAPGRRALFTTFSTERRPSGNRPWLTHELSRHERPTHAWLSTQALLAEDDQAALARINQAVRGCVPPKRYATPADVGPTKVEARITLTRTEAGGVSSVTFSDQLGLRAEEQSCFEAKLREVGFPCPLGHEPWELRLRGERAISYAAIHSSSYLAASEKPTAE